MMIAKTTMTAKVGRFPLKLKSVVYCTRIEPFHLTDTEFLISAPGSPKPPSRPLTPLSECLEVGLPADTYLTAADACTYRGFRDPPNDRLGTEILVHAKVYCFAHRYCIRELEAFALQRLTKVLIVVDIEEDAVFPSLADAIRIVYDSTPGANLQHNPARNLLSQYVALHYTRLPTESLDRVMAEGGDFVVDLSHKLARRLRTRS